MEQVNRTDRVVLRLALARGEGRLRRPTALGYGVVAGRLAELVVLRSLVTDHGLASPTDPPGPLGQERDLQQLRDQVTRAGAVPWTQLFWRDHSDVDAAFRQTIRWLVQHRVWQRRPLVIRRGRGYTETSSAPKPSVTDDDEALRVDVAAAILDVIEASARRPGSSSRASGPTGRLARR